MHVSRTWFLAPAGVLLAASASAQCVPQWSEEFDPGDPDGGITSMVWHDDGSGLRLYAFGAFSTIGGVSSDRAARWDGSTWEATPVASKAVVWQNIRARRRASGETTLLAIGAFADRGYSTVAVWNGKQYEPLPLATPWAGRAYDAVWFDRDGPGPEPEVLVVAGDFIAWPDAQQSAAALVWDGQVWRPIPGNLGTLSRHTLAVFDPDADGPLAPYVVMSAINTSVSTYYWKYAGRVSESDPGQFTSMPHRPRPAADMLVHDFDGAGAAPAQLVACERGVPSSALSPIATFNGTAWTEILPAQFQAGSTLSHVDVWDRDGDGPAPGVLAFSGAAQRPGDPTTYGVVTWDGAALTFEHPGSRTIGAPIPPGTDPAGVFPTMVLGRNPGVLAPGLDPASGLAVYDDGYVDVGLAPKGAPNGSINKLITYDPDADGPEPRRLISWGAHTSVGYVYTGAFATRGVDGWSGDVRAPFPEMRTITGVVAIDPDGPGPSGDELWATGAAPVASESCVRRWSGSTWDALPNSLLSSTAIFDDAVAFDFDGPGPQGYEVVVCGQFSAIGGVASFDTARYDGMSWHEMPRGVIGTRAVDLAVVDFDGAGPQPPQLFAGGYFPLGVARWNASSWGGLGFATLGRALALEEFDPDGPGPANPVLAIAGALSVGDVFSTLWYYNGVTLTPAPGFAVSPELRAIAAFDADGPDGPDAPALYVSGLSVSGPFLRRVSAGGWTEPEGGDVNGVLRGLAVFDEDGAGPNPGGLYAFGSITRAGDTPSGYLARLGCPVGPSCITDWDSSGTVNSTDVSLFINDWFADLGEGTLRTDFDHNGVVNSTDVGDFITAWFEQSAKGCG